MADADAKGMTILVISAVWVGVSGMLTLALAFAATRTPQSLTTAAIGRRPVVKLPLRPAFSTH